MTGFVRETMYFVFDRWAVAWTYTLFRPTVAIHRRTIQACSDNVVCAGIGMGHPTRKLLRMHVRRTHIGKYRNRVAITGLLFGLGKVDAAGIDTGRRPGF